MSPSVIKWMWSGFWHAGFSVEGPREPYWSTCLFCFGTFRPYGFNQSTVPQREWEGGMDRGRVFEPERTEMDSVSLKMLQSICQKTVVNLNFKTEFMNRESPYCRDADRKWRQSVVSFITSNLKWILVWYLVHLFLVFVLNDAYGAT